MVNGSKSTNKYNANFFQEKEKIGNALLNLQREVNKDIEIRVHNTSRNKFLEKERLIQLLPKMIQK